MKKKNIEENNKPEVVSMPKKQLNELKNKNLPYIKIYPELDIIETSQGTFTKTYMLRDMDYDKAKDMETMEFFLKYSKVLNNLDNEFDIELTIFNKNETINKNTKAKYLISDNSKQRELTDEYNTFITTLLNKRAVNTFKEKYITLSIQGDFVEDVLKKFEEAEKILKASINDIADANIGIVSTTKRVELLYNIYNPGNENLFKDKMAEAGNLDAATMKKKKITSKDIIFPKIFNVCDSFIELDKQFCRSLYLSDIPSSLSENIVSELTNINIPMITSAHFKPIDPDNALKNLLADKEKMKKDLLAAQEKSNIKNKKGYKLYKKQEQIQTEEIHINNPLLDTIEEELRKAIENKEKMFFINMSLTHYNSTLELLDKDTDVIQSFLSKILCKMDKCVYNQENGFVTTLPLGVNRLKSDRVFDSLNAAFFTPFNPQDILRKNGLCYGTNSINKDLVIINRRNSKQPNGFILAASNSVEDRVVEVKREMLINHIGSKDRVVMITSNNDYDNFFKAMKGEIVSDLEYNALTTHKLYADSNKPEEIKYKYFLALLTSLNKGPLKKDEKILAKDIILFMVDNDFYVCLKDVIDHFRDEKYKKIIDLLKLLPDRYLGAKSRDFTTNDFTLYKTNGSLEDIVVTLDYVWNEMINACAKKQKTWIYIDDVEKIFNYRAVSIFLTELFQRSSFFESIITMTTENTHVLINISKEADSSLSMLQNSGYVKLLGLSVLDRDILQKYLNITNIFLPFISQNKPGSGIILTSECSFAFKENFPEDSTFYKLIHT